MEEDGDSQTLRQRNRHKDKPTHTYIDRPGQTNRHTSILSNTDRNPHTEKKSLTKTKTHTHSHRNKETQTQLHTPSHTHTNTHTQSETHTQSHTPNYAHIHTPSIIGQEVMIEAIILL